MSKPKSRTTKPFPKWLETCRWHWDKGTTLHRDFRPGMTYMFSDWAAGKQPLKSALEVVKQYEVLLRYCDRENLPLSEITQCGRLLPATNRTFILLPTAELLPTESIIPCPVAIKAAAEVWLEEDFADYDRHRPLLVAVRPCPFTGKSFTCIEYFTHNP